MAPWAMPVSSSACCRVARCSGPTVSSVTMTQRRCGRMGAMWTPARASRLGADQHLVAGLRQGDGDAARRGVGGQGGQHGLGGHLGRVLRAIDDEVRQRIDRGALVRQLLQDLRGVAGVEQRAVRPALHPAQQHRQRAAQPHGGGAGADQGAGVGVHEGAAAGGEDDGGAVEQALDDALLAGAEIGLAVAGEDLGDAGVGGDFDLVVGVVEGQAEFGGEALADGGFAGAHQPDQDDAARRRAGRRRGGRDWVERHGGAGFIISKAWR